MGVPGECRRLRRGPLRIGKVRKLAVGCWLVRSRIAPDTGQPSPGPGRLDRASLRLHVVGWCARSPIRLLESRCGEQLP
jgi:hypothetical protein